MMAEAPFSDDDSGPSLKFFSSGQPGQQTPSFLDDDNLVPSEDRYSPVKFNGDCIYPTEQEITESLDQLSTKSDQNSPDTPNEDSDSEEHYRKKARVGNHYQARIPKYLTDMHRDAIEDEVLWNPFTLDAEIVEEFLRRLSAASKLLIPMGNHLRDDEEALYILQKNSHDVEAAFQAASTNLAATKGSGGVWSEEECRNFEKGLLSFGKNFFLIQKYKLNSRRVGELVQFYYLWKKTARYDLFANKMRGGKKKYALNPGISDLMCRYVGGQSKEVEAVASEVQFIVTDSRKNVQDGVQY